MWRCSEPFPQVSYWKLNALKNLEQQIYSRNVDKVHSISYSIIYQHRGAEAIILQTERPLKSKAMEALINKVGRCENR